MTRPFKCVGVFGTLAFGLMSISAAEATTAAQRLQADRLSNMKPSKTFIQTGKPVVTNPNVDLKGKAGPGWPTGDLKGKAGPGWPTVDLKGKAGPGWPTVDTNARAGQPLKPGTVAAFPTKPKVNESLNVQRLR